jgi:hypothetical protein
MKNLMAPLALLFAAGGCIHVDAPVILDRATALEEQAAGSFDELEEKLNRAGIAPRPVPLTPEELDALGIRRAELVNDTELTDADKLDRLLRQRCVGEAKDGLVVETPEACKGAMDKDAVGRLLEGTNRARAQLWQWMREERPKASVDDVKRSWRLAHLRGVVCGGWVQKDDGAWEAKKCS